LAMCGTDFRLIPGDALMSSFAAVVLVISRRLNFGFL
jgi:hypothetical protein